VADIMRVKAVSTGFTGGPGFSQFYFAVAVYPLNGAAAVLACNRVRDAYTAIKSQFPPLWSISVDPAVETLDPSSGTLTGVLSGAGSTVVGSSGSAGFKASPVGMLTQWITGDVADGHLVRGRTFHVPLANALNDNAGVPGTGAVAGIQPFGVAMTSPGATDCIFGVWHRPRQAKAGPPPVSFRPGSFHSVTGSAVPNEFVVLRSRRD
jgi:hypothetical protein